MTPVWWQHILQHSKYGDILYLWDRFSQFLTGSSSVWEVLQGISWETLPACLGGSEVPSRL